MTDFIKPITMILTLQALQHMGRHQLSIGLIACFRLGAAHCGSLLTETASHAAWSRLAGPLTPIDSGIPANAQRIVVHDSYTVMSTAQSHGAHGAHDAHAPCLFGMETITLESKLRGRPVLSMQLPGIRAQCFVEWAGTRDERVRKLDPQIESLRLSPRLDCAWLMYRAVTPLADARIDDIVGVSADWIAIDQPTVRPGHCLPAGTDRCTRERSRHAAERETSRQVPARSICAS